jgi:hypothetical protein
MCQARVHSTQLLLPQVGGAVLEVGGEVVSLGGAVVVEEEVDTTVHEVEVLVSDLDSTSGEEQLQNHQVFFRSFDFKLLPFNKRN